MGRTPRSLRGRIAFITGSARGIGRATAHALVREGARVVIADLDGDLATRTAREIGAVASLQVDVTDHDAFTSALDQAEREVGPLDVLINNAGVMAIGVRDAGRGLGPGCRRAARRSVGRFGSGRGRPVEFSFGPDGTPVRADTLGVWGNWQPDGFWLR